MARLGRPEWWPWDWSDSGLLAQLVDQQVGALYARAYPKCYLDLPALVSKVVSSAPGGVGAARRRSPCRRLWLSGGGG